MPFLLAVVPLFLPQDKRLEPRTLIDCGSPLSDIALNGSCDTIFTLTKAGLISAWKRDTAKETWNHIEPAAWGIECSDRGLVATMKVPLAATYDMRSGERLALLQGSQDGNVTSFVADSRGRWAWVGSATGVVRMGELPAWKYIPLDNGGVTALALGLDGDRLAVGGHDGSVRFVNTKDATEDVTKTVPRLESPVTALALGTHVLIAAAEDGSIHAWKVPSYKEQFLTKPTNVAVRALVLCSKPAWFAYGDAGGAVRLGDLAQGQLLAQWSTDALPVVALSYVEKDNSILAAAGTCIVALAIK